MMTVSEFLTRGTAYAARRWHGVRRYLHVYDPEERRVLSFRGRYANGTCFVVGNGPSLSVQDLENIRRAGGVCFASNKIYKIYPLTDWRPDYYACIDWRLFEQNRDELLDAVVCPSFFCREFLASARAWAHDNHKSIEQTYYMTYGWRHSGKTVFYPQAANILSGGTVTFTLMELAWMMGFRNIVLIGCDHYYGSFAGETPHSAIIATDALNRDYAVPDYVRPGEEVGVGDIEEMEYSYESARRYAEKHGGEIINATRGGRLEIFKREDLDVVLGKIQNGTF